MRPGFDVELRDGPVPESAPTDTSLWFVVGPTQKGPVVPTLSRSPDEWKENHGGVVSFSHLPAAVEQFFAEGGSGIYTQRIVGPDAEVATKSFNDGAGVPAATLAVDAAHPGAWGNSLRVAIVIDDDEFSIRVEDADENVLEVSPAFAAKSEAVEWGADSPYIRVRSLAPVTLPVAAAATALLTGADDIEGITNAEYIAGLVALPRWLGPGQVSIPGATTQALHTAVLAHAAVTSRRAVLAAPDSPTRAVLVAAANAHKADVNSRFGGLFGPWDIVAGRLPNTTQVVPPEGRVAGLIARSDGTTGNPNLPAAGDNGRARATLGVTQVFTDEDYTVLNEAGVNMSRTLFGDDVVLYGFRTLVDPDEDPRWVELSGSRTVMHVTSQSNAVMAGFAFDQIDGQGHKFAELEGALISVCLPLHAMGALYGKEPSDAFRVDVGPSVNTPARVQNRELRAVVALKTSPFAEHVVTEIVRRMVGEGV